MVVRREFGEPQRHLVDLSPEPIDEEEWEISPTQSISERLSEWVPDFLVHIERRVTLTRLCESPIEIDLGAALIALAGERCRIIPQFKLFRYRYDFAVMGETTTPLALVECDGEAFHSTKEQLANDRAKDDAAVRAGTRVLRISGKDIYRSPELCAAVVLRECGQR
jgi:very-short-patch-repair endonuclease